VLLQACRGYHHGRRLTVGPRKLAVFRFLQSMWAGRTQGSRRASRSRRKRRSYSMHDASSFTRSMKTDFTSAPFLRLSIRSLRGAELVRHGAAPAHRVPAVVYRGKPRWQRCGAHDLAVAHATTSRLLLSSLVHDPVLSMRLTHLRQQPAPILHFSVPVRTAA
jgi:hypothetical protein